MSQGEKVQTTLDKEPHGLLVNLAKKEGRTLSKMLSIVCDFYSKNGDAKN